MRLTMQRATLHFLLCTWLISLGSVWAQETPVNLRSADYLATPSTAASSLSSADLSATEDDATTLQLRLSAQLAPSAAPVAQSPTVRAAPVTVAPRSTQAATPTALIFAWSFALLLLLSFVVRDGLRTLLRLIFYNPHSKIVPPHAKWPSLCVVFAAADISSLRKTLLALGAQDYPTSRLQIFALCDLQQAANLTALAEASQTLPKLQPFHCVVNDYADPGQLCFRFGLRYSQHAIVLALPTCTPDALASHALKRCASAFLNPEIGALLGTAHHPHNPQARLTERLGTLQRAAIQAQGSLPVNAQLPGTALLAIRRAAVLAVGADPEFQHGSYPFVSGLLRSGYRCETFFDLVALDHHDPQTGREHWLRSRTQADFQRAPGRRFKTSGISSYTPSPPDSWLCLLWLGILCCALVLYLCGQSTLAGLGLLCCGLTAFGLDGRPATPLSTILLLRRYGRHQDLRLLALTPWVFGQDLSVIVSACVQQARRTLRPASIQRDTPSPAPH